MRKYKIYRLENKKKIPIEIVELENDQCAIDRVSELRKNENSNTIFWKHADGVNILGENGEIEEKYNDIEEQLEHLSTEEENWPFYKKIYYGIVRWWNTYDPWFNTKLGFERMFKKYDRTMSWNIDYAVFDLLKRTIPKLMENAHGCPTYYCDKAKEILNNANFDDPDKKPDEKHHTSHREMEVAMALFKCDLHYLLENIVLFEYYRDFGIENENEYEMVKYKYSIPKLENSEEIDYEKLSELSEKTLDKIFDYLRHHITELWD